MRIDWPGKRFVSVEPMLEEIDADFCDAGVALGACDECGCRGSNPACAACCGLASIDWVICGGESGPRHRPFDLEWARSLRNECEDVGVPFFFKQTSGNPPEKMPMLDGKVWAERPE
jgi:protein gp37